MHADNILCIEENLECKFVDMDNVDILGMKRDTTPNLLRYYMQSGGKDNENALIYLFNFLTYQFIIKHNKSINLDKDAIMLCKNINCDFVDSICDHEYLIDFIDKPSKILFR